jgi:hypothetical protein
MDTYGKLLSASSFQGHLEMLWGRPREEMVAHGKRSSGGRYVAKTRWPDCMVMQADFEEGIERGAAAVAGGC